MKIRPMGTELFHADKASRQKQKDRYAENEKGGKKERYKEGRKNRYGESNARVWGGGGGFCEGF
jgi:hypothetical protein